MWSKPVITKASLMALCRVLVLCAKKWNFIIPTRINELYTLCQIDPEKALKGLCAELTALEYVKPLTQRVTQEENRRENNGI